MSAPATRCVVYNDAIARRFVGASVVWGIVAMLVGAFAALELLVPGASASAPWLAFGRLRPLHTNAAIFAFVGNMIFAGIYYSTQRLLKTRLASDTLAGIHFWGWQAIIAAAAVTLPMGFTQAKEYAELEWPIDLAITFVWVVFATNFFWTLKKRNEKQLYVGIWFYIATIVTVAVLHVVNSLAIPVFAMKSYSVFGGVQDALVQWWYGHNAVAFFLTTPVLGIMYYFVPKAAERPVYSYRLSVIHFWALIFMYIWAGPHHLLYTALPDWAQTLGMVFSLMLWAPSWGGMLNGLFTIRGAWDRVKSDPVLKFFVAALTFYGMATFEGPLLSIKSVSSLAHYTDWIIGHVHVGALGWNGLMAAGMFYWMVPRLFGTKLYSKGLADLHFYLGTVGILLYAVAMWVGGITQGTMWRALDAHGALVYPSFVETLVAIRPMYFVRLAGGTMYLAGMIVMAYNLARTAKAGAAVDGEALVTVEPEPAQVPWTRVVFGAPVLVTGAVGAVLAYAAVTNAVASLTLATLTVGVAVFAVIAFQVAQRPGEPTWHRLLEGRAAPFTALTVLAVLAGGVAEILPTVLATPAREASPDAKMLTALELEGRDVYLREGCYNCHSQMIRPLVGEVVRYGEPSREAESRYDHPFQWGSKRTGPDLARIGDRYPALWHVRHLEDPRAVTPGSNMPSYAFLENAKVDFARTVDKLGALKTVGVPYTDARVASAAADARAQGETVARGLAEVGADASPDSEMVALVAYLMQLGRAPAPPPAAPGVALAPARTSDHGVTP
jgi:cytochrome c oxidase cbb3-type subunit I/II